jgi:hypothetical protein
LPKLLPALSIWALKNFPEKFLAYAHNVYKDWADKTGLKKRLEICLFFFGVFAIAIVIATAVIVFFFKNHKPNLI